MSKHFQCRLSQGNSRTVGYIEERGAVVGYSVEIEELGGFWTVDSVGHEMNKKDLRNKQRANRNSCTSIK